MERNVQRLSPNAVYDGELKKKEKHACMSPVIRYKENISGTTLKTFKWGEKCSEPHFLNR